MREKLRMTMNKIGFKTLGIGCSLAVAWALGACSSSSDGNTTATGGTTAGGGQTGMGGGTSTGGLSATGGFTTTTGGTLTNTGGTVTTGGTTGSPTGGTTSTTGGTAAGGTSGTVGGSTSGGGTSAGGSTAAPAEPVTGFNVLEGGFIKFCGLSGYSWTASGPPTPDNTTGSVSSIDPADFSTLAAGTSLCASGVVAADAAYGGYAIVGVNIGQEAGEETPNANVTPTGTGITVNVTNPGKSKLRVQIQDDLGSDDAEHRWCADVPSSGVGSIPWTEFNTMCWEPADGTAYAMQPLNAIMIIVPGGNSKDTTFDFCLNGFTVDGVDCPVDTGGGEGGAPGTGGASGDTGGSSGETGGTTGDTGGGTGDLGGATGDTGGTSGGGSTATGGAGGSTGGTSATGGASSTGGGTATTGGNTGSGGSTVSASA